MSSGSTLQFNPETVKMVNMVMHERFELSTEQLTHQAQLKDDLKLDSLDFVDMIVSFEDRINRKLDNIDITSIRTLGDIYQLVDAEIGQDANKEINQ